MVDQRVRVTPTPIDVHVPAYPESIDVIVGAGAPGPMGPPGPPGPPGPVSGATILYTATWVWTTNTTDASTAGQIGVGINAATWAAKLVNVNELNKDGADVSFFLNQVQRDDELYLQQKSDSTRFGRYKVVSGIDRGGWRSYAVAPLSNGGAIPADNADCSLVILVQPKATT